ncbi:hypothetical protein Dda_5015 [Drechslerella dactyloides]|uniref:RNase III domain-containing protein n=1 Tax=Drechslerella dactyloides TaxID=74499 RepID=A0AAD6NIG4_DREDA|nr:hypothetical protein Dda_5015 [Drechslerella dactyloides]
MLAGSTRSSPQPRASSPPWFANYPELNPPDDHYKGWPPQMLEFTNEEMQRLVFLPRVSRRALDPNDVTLNERAAFFGEGLLTALVSDFLYTEFIDCKAHDLTAMRQALLAPSVLSNLCQRVNLTAYIRSSPPDRRPDDQALARTFQAYIGGIHHDRGADGYLELRNWFYVLIKPYAMQCKANYEQYIEAYSSVSVDPRLAALRLTDSGSSSSPFGHPGSSSTSRHSRMPSSGYRGYSLDDPAQIARPGTAAPGLGMYVTSGSSSYTPHISRGIGDYIKELKEYCEKHRLPAPIYTDMDNGKSGDHIKWWSTVNIGDKYAGESTSWAPTKKEAKAMASKVALNHLRGSYRS